MRALVSMGSVVAVAGVIGYAAWSYDNRLVAEARGARGLGGSQTPPLSISSTSGGQGMTLALPAVIVIGLALLASIDGTGGELPGHPSCPSGFGYGSYL